MTGPRPTPPRPVPYNQTPEQAKAAAARQALMDRITIRASSTPRPQGSPIQRPTPAAQAQQRLQQPLQFPDFTPGQPSSTTSVLVGGEEFDLQTGKKKETQAFSTNPGVPVPTPERVPTPQDVTKARLIPEKTGPGVFLDPGAMLNNVTTGFRNLARDPLGSLERTIHTIEEPLVRGAQLPFRAAGVEDLSALPNLPDFISHDPLARGVEQGRGGLIGDIVSQPGRLLVDPLFHGINALPGVPDIPGRFLPSQLARELSEGFTKPRATLNPLPLGDLERLSNERRDLDLSFAQDIGAGLPLELATAGLGSLAKRGADAPKLLRLLSRAGIDDAAERVGPRGGQAIRPRTATPTPPTPPTAAAPTVGQTSGQALADIIRRRRSGRTPEAGSIGPRARGPVGLADQVADTADLPVRGTKSLEEWMTEVKAWEQGRRIGRTVDEGHQTLSQAATSISAKAVENARMATQADIPVEEVARAVAETKTDEVLDALHAGSNAGKGRVNKSNLINRVVESIIQVGSESRLAMTIADWSAPFRQGGVLSASNPREWLRSWKAMAQATKDPAVARRIMDDIYDDDIVKNVFLSDDRGTKLEITEFGGFRIDPKTGKLRVEEGFEGEVLRRIQGVGQVVDMSERSFAVFLNRLRVDVAKKYYKTWLRQNKGRPLDPKQIDELMEFINAATGRGNLPEWMQRRQKLFSAAFFSPRYLASRVQLPYMLLRSSPAVRGLVARSLVAWAGMMFTTLTLFDMTPGVEVNWNPQHSDFGKITIGKMRFDILSGYAPLLRVFARVGLGRTRGRGYTADVSRWDELKRFARSKASPLAGFAYDMITDEQFNGQEFMAEGTIFGKEVPGPVDAFYENFTPLVFQEIVEAAEEEGLFGAVAATPALFGVGVNTYSTVDDVALDVYGQPFEELWPYEQSDVRETLRLSKDEVSVYYSRVIAAEQTFKTEIEALAQRAPTMEKRDVQEKYRAIGDDLRDAKNAARLSAFGEDDNNIEFIAGGTPAESAALAEYYDIGNTVDSSAEWNDRFEELSKKWAQEGTLEYVQANTNMYDIPQAVWDKLSTGQRTRYRDSYQARINRAADLPRRVEQLEGAVRSAPQEGARPLPPVPPPQRGGRSAPANPTAEWAQRELGKRALLDRIGAR